MAVGRTQVLTGYWPETSVPFYTDIDGAAHNMAAGFLQKLEERMRENEQDESYGLIVT